MRISVIIPVHSGGAMLQSCLEALGRTQYDNWECILVDDGSSDDLGEIGARYPIRVIQSGRPQGGPANARNQGVHVAGGDVLLFIDADVLVTPHTVAQVAHVMQTHTGIAACFGSYDDAPTAPNFLSQYRNLLHHFVHQTSNQEATTFWSGCGAISRAVFLELGGFNTGLYARPSIEDIELGYRMLRAGYRIKLVKSLQVTHMKRWTARKILVTDIFHRAIPWARLILKGGGIPNNLNLKVAQRVSAAAAGIGSVALATGLVLPGTFLLVLPAIAILLVCNHRFYGFLVRKRGIGFTLCAIPWHWLYFLYSGLSFGGCFLRYRLFKWKHCSLPIVAKSITGTPFRRSGSPN